MSDEPVRDAGDQDDEAAEPGEFAEPSPEDFAAEPATPPAPGGGGTNVLRLVALALIGLLVVAPLVILPMALSGRTKGDASTAWRTFTSPGSEPWQADLPAEPTFTTSQVAEPALVVTEARLATPGGAFSIKSTTLPDAYLPGASTDELLAAWDRLLAGDASPEARRVVARGTDQLDGLPAQTLDLALTPADARLKSDARVWLVAVGRRVYAFGAIRPPGDLAHPDVRRFVDSVRLPR